MSFLNTSNIYTTLVAYSLGFSFILWFIILLFLNNYTGIYQGLWLILIIYVFILGYSFGLKQIVILFQQKESTPNQNKSKNNTGYPSTYSF